MRNKIEFINNGVSSDIDKIMSDKTVKKVAIMIERADAPEKEKWKKPNLPDFLLCFSEFCYKIMKLRLKGETMRLLWLLLSIMEFNNLVDIDIQFCLVELGCSRKSIYNGIGELLDKGVMVKGKRPDGRECYIINNNAFWKGSDKERKEFIRLNGEMPKLLTVAK